MTPEGAHTGSDRCCRECKRAYERAYYARNREKKKASVNRWRAKQDPEQLRAYWKQKHKKNREKERLRQRRYRALNVERVRLWERKYYAANTDKCLERKRRYQQLNPGKVKASQARRRAALLQATPPWVDFEAIRAIYAHCPPGYEVDHIVPLCGANVRGLHVPWNFQYLTKSENVRKGNRF